MNIFTTTNIHEISFTKDNLESNRTCLKILAWINSNNEGKLCWLWNEIYKGITFALALNGECKIENFRKAIWKWKKVKDKGIM